MNNGGFTEMSVQKGIAQSESLVICRGETLGEAVRRHWRVHGVGPLTLKRNRNAGVADRRVYSAAA